MLLVLSYPFELEANEREHPSSIFFLAMETKVTETKHVHMKKDLSSFTFRPAQKTDAKMIGD